MRLDNNYEADLLDAMADEHNELSREMEYIELWEEIEEQALMYGTPIAMIKPDHALYQIVQWIIKYGEIKKTIPLADGRMTTKQEVVDLGFSLGGKYYLKTGWYTKDGLSCHTLTPDEFILELVGKEVADGKVI